MANTDLGFPYSIGTDPPAGFSQIQDLAEAVDLQPGVGSYTQTQITAFTVAEKRSGRVVFNSTLGLLQKSNGSAFKTVENVPIVTSSTRPSTPPDGWLIFETDTRKLMAYALATTTWDEAGGGSAYVNIDGGDPTSTYGAITNIDAGGV
jgi:hypothetical protein